MSASLVSGTYGRQASFSSGLRQLVSLFSGAFAPAAQPIRPASSFRARVREANDVRALARSVELHSPGFAADLYAAASRHEGLDD